MNARKGTEEINEQGGIETKVETVDYRSPAGKDGEATKDKVGVVHLIRDKASSGSRGGVLARAADAVSKTIKSAKDAVWGSSNK